MNTYFSLLGTNSEDDETFSLFMLVTAVVIAFLFIIIVLLAVILCCICCKKSNSDKYNVEAVPKATTVHEGYEMFTANTLPSSLTKGVTNAMKNDYDYPQLPLEIENGKHIDDPEYSTPECKKSKPSSKGSSSTLPASFA